jgi:hypothetical protein
LPKVLTDIEERTFLSQISIAKTKKQFELAVPDKIADVFAGEGKDVFSYHGVLCYRESNKENAKSGPKSMDEVIHGDKTTIEGRT